jgi:hypothetical protein
MDLLKLIKDALTHIENVNFLPIDDDADYFVDKLVGRLEKKERVRPLVRKKDEE